MTAGSGVLTVSGKAYGFFIRPESQSQLIRRIVSIPLISALEGTQQGLSWSSPGRSRPRELGRYEMKRQSYERTRQPEG
jgi:hypothetical protein